MTPPQIPDYQFLDLLGEGSFGWVWRAMWRGSQERAVKVFKKNRVDIGMVDRELKKLQLVREHSGIVSVYDFDLICDTPYYAMSLHAQRHAEQWQGRTLERLCGTVGSDETVRLLRQVADALAYLHTHRVIHCDVKPSNVLLTDESPPHVKLCDFGQSRGSASVQLEVTGTPFYAPPEQLRHPGDSGPDEDGRVRGYRWDVYSYGVLAFKLATGKLPRLEELAEDYRRAASGEQSLASPDRTLHDHIPADHLAAMTEAAGEKISWSAACPLGLEERSIIAKCLHLNPAQRWSDMEEVKAAFAEVELAREKRRTARFRNLALLASLLALTALGAGVYARGQQREAEAQKREAEIQKTVAEAQKQEAEFQKAAAEAQKAEAVKHQQMAEHARGTAEGIINEMLFNLRDALQPIGRLGLLDQVSKSAQGYFERLPAEQRTVEAQRNEGVMWSNRGDVLLAQGDLVGALAAYRKRMEIAERLARQDETNTQWQRDLAIGHNMIGNVLRAQGDLAGALAAYRRDMEITERLAQQDETNTEWQRDLSVSHERIGDVLQAQGDLAGALAAYRKAMEIRERLVKQDESNAERQRDLSVSHERIGDVLQAQGDLVGAPAAYRKAMEIRERLAQQGETNTEWQRDLSVSHNKIGNVLQAQGDLVGALAAYRKAMEIRERLAQQDETNTQWQRDLSVGHNMIGNVLRAQGDLAGALAAYRRGMEITERLAQQDETNTQWQRDLSVGHNMIGNVLRAQGDLAGALAAYRRDMEITERLAQQDETNTEWQRDLSVSHERIGDLLQTQGDLSGALEHFVAEKEIARRLLRQTAEALPPPGLAGVLGYACLSEAQCRAGITPPPTASELRAILEEGRTPLLQLKNADRLPPQQARQLANLEAELAKLEGKP